MNVGIFMFFDDLGDEGKIWLGSNFRKINLDF